MTAGLLESAPMHRRRHRTRITFPSTTPVAWDQELRLLRQEVPVLPARQGAGLLPGQRGDTHEVDPQTELDWGSKTHRKAGESQSPAQPWGAPGL